jgi:RNA polymerase sigma-70 factor, ECF subfamily
MEERKLLKKLKEGDPKAVRFWFEQYHQRLLSLVVTKVSNYNDAEEIVQQTFLNCLKHLPLFMGKSTIWTWMNSVAKHEVADYFRKKYAKKALKTIPFSDIFMIEGLTDSSGVSNEVRSRVKRVLLTLEQNHSSDKYNKGYKELLLLKYVDGKKVKTIAKELGRSVKSIESDLFRARKMFREIWLTLD